MTLGEGIALIALYEAGRYVVYVIWEAVKQYREANWERKWIGQDDARSNDIHDE